MTVSKELIKTAADVEAYTEAHLFDANGLLLSGVDSHTNTTFERDQITPDIVPRRARFSPWSYWTYEDSVMTAGHYIDGLVIKHRVTGDEVPLARAKTIWETYLGVAHQSQSYGDPGCFLRPYGGFDELEQFGEPLGTDQAAPLFIGVWRLLPYLAGSQREETVRILLNMLTWYADRGYAYRYYKCIQHHWRAPLHHASSYYLPAIAWAAKETGEPRWQQELDRWLETCLNDPDILAHPHGIAWNFKQGGLLALRDILGAERFDAAFTPAVLSRIYQDVQQMLEHYDEPGCLRRIHAASREPGFRPHLRQDFNPDVGMGYIYFASIHGGRVRPRHELTLLTALAGLGVDGAGEQVAELFDLRRRVPQDFTHFLSEEYELLPRAVHLYGRSVGGLMLDWWRNLWVLRAGLSSPSA